MGIKINLCCGRYTIDKWLNLDPRAFLHPSIIEWKWGERIPCNDSVAELVYVGYGFLYSRKEFYKGHLKEIFRVLEDDGMLVIKEDNDILRVWKPIGTKHFTGKIKSTSNPQEMLEMVKGAGFKGWIVPENETTFEEFDKDLRWMLLGTHVKAFEKSYIIVATKS